MEELTSSQWPSGKWYWRRSETASYDNGPCLEEMELSLNLLLFPAPSWSRVVAPVRIKWRTTEDRDIILLSTGMFPRWWLYQSKFCVTSMHQCFPGLRVCGIMLQHYIGPIILVYSMPLVNSMPCHAKLMVQGLCNRFSSINFTNFPMQSFSISSMIIFWSPMVICTKWWGQA